MAAKKGSPRSTKGGSKDSKLGQSPWKSVKPMSPVTKKNTTPQLNKDAYQPAVPTLGRIVGRKGRRK